MASIEKLKPKAEGAKKFEMKEFLIENSLYIFILAAVAYIQFKEPSFLSLSSVINILSMSAAAMPIALGIAGCIILTGTDLSAGRCVGLTACVSASLLQTTGYVNKMFPDLKVPPIILIIGLSMAIGAVVGCVNGFCVSKFSLHPFIVTLSTQLMLYGVILMYLKIGTNNGQSISGLDASYTKFIKGSLFSIGDTAVPNYLLY
ncbi:MAG: beta-methylgalactoside transporter, partial [Oscillospiraceae bacterium]